MRFTGAVIAVLLLGACGGSDPASPAVSTITVSAATTGNIESIGDTRTVTAVAKDAAGGVVSSPSIAWSSSATSVAIVTGSGSSVTVTAVGNGTATITATSGSASNSITLTVAQKFASLSVAAPPTLAPGATVQLVATARDARNAPIQSLSTGFTFTSSDQGKAIVNATTGVVTAIAPGTANIVASLSQNGTVLGTGQTQVVVSFGTASPNSAAVTANTQSVFTPSSVVVGPGGTVTWAFQTLEHNVVFNNVANVPQNIPNSTSTSVARTFTTAGSFAYQCTIHGGMTGLVVVAAGTSPSFTTLLNGANEKPAAVVTNGSGSAFITVNGTTVTYTVAFSGLSGPPTMSHIHAPGLASATAGVIVDFPTAGVTTNAGVLSGSFTAADIRSQGGQPPIALDSLLKLIGNGNAYVNVHTAQNPAGEIRGQLGPPSN